MTDPMKWPQERIMTLPRTEGETVPDNVCTVWMPVETDGGWARECMVRPIDLPAAMIALAKRIASAIGRF